MIKLEHFIFFTF